MRRLLILLTTLMLMTLPTFAQEEDVEELCFQNGGFIDEETGECNVNLTLEIHAAYPVQYNDIPFVMEHLDGIFDAEIATFMEMFVEAGVFPTYGGWALDMTYEEIRHSDTIFTVLIEQYQYTGGAHGITLQFSHTYDTESETILTLDDVFTDVDAGLAVVAPIAVEQIEETLEGYTDADWLQRGTDPTNPDNYAVWALTEDSINFYFAQYQVAAYAAGLQMVSIPFADIADVLEPEFVPGT